MSLEQKGNFFLLSSRDNWNELNDITKAQRPGSRKWEMTAAESNIAWKIDSPIQPSVPVMIYCLPTHVNVVCQLAQICSYHTRTQWKVMKFRGSNNHSSVHSVAFRNWVTFCGLKSINSVNSYAQGSFFINWQLMSTVTSLERFGEEDPFFINWRSCSRKSEMGDDSSRI